MKVYIVSTESFPNGLAATQRIRCYAKAISENGDDCEVLLVNRLEEKNASRDNLSAEGRIGVYHYRYVGGSSIKASNRLRRIFDQVYDVLALSRYLIKNLSSEDRILFYSYNRQLLKIVTRIAKVKNVPVFFELCEHPSIQISDFNYTDEEQVYKNIRKVLNGVSGIFVISKTLKDLVEKAWKHKMPTCLVPILFEDDTLPSKVESIDGRYIIHSGSLRQNKDGVLNLIKAFSIAKSQIDESIKYYMTGFLSKSEDKEAIEALIKEQHLEDDVVFLGFLDHDLLESYQRNAYMAIIYKEDNIQNRFCFATKTGEYLKAGTLLVHSRNGEIMNYLEDGNDCAYYDNSVEELANLIVKFFNDKSARDRIAANGKQKAHDFFLCSNYGRKMAEFMSNNDKPIIV